jgi:hypothetical protein
MRTMHPLAPLLALTLVAGCGGSDDPPEPTTVSVTAPATTASTAATSTTSETTLPTEPDGGNGSTPRPGSGEGAANAVVAAAAVLTTDGTPDQACGSYVTENFIETSYGGEQNCIAAREGAALARSISVGPGDDELSTHIVVVPTGGPYDGAKVEVELVEDDGYRVDALDAHVPAGP